MRALGQPPEIFDRQRRDVINRPERVTDIRPRVPTVTLPRTIERRGNVHAASRGPFNRLDLRPASDQSGDFW